MVDIQTVSIMLASASVIAGVVYYSLQIRHQNLQIQQQNKLRQTDLIMRLYSVFISKEFEEAWYKVSGLEFRDYDDFVGKYGSIFSETPINVAFAMVTMFFDGMGVLLHRKLADFDLIYDLFRGGITVTWEKVKPVIEGYRKQYDELKEDLQYFEYLYDEVQKRKQRGAHFG